MKRSIVFLALVRVPFVQAFTVIPRLGRDRKITSQSPRHYSLKRPTILTTLASKSGGEKQEQSTEEILKELNEKFDYDGRMPSTTTSAMHRRVEAPAAGPSGAIRGSSANYSSGYDDKDSNKDGFDDLHAFSSSSSSTTTSSRVSYTSSSSDTDRASTFESSNASVAAVTIDIDFRCGFVVVMGAPNMGKSTLVNALLQEDLCIATARPQTTRHAILGILAGDTSQVCLVDTPGILDKPAYKLQEGMMEAVVGAFHDADVLLVVTDLFSTPIPNDKLFAKVQASRKPVIVAVNKVDLASAVNPISADKKESSSIKKTYTVEQAVARWRELLPNALAILPMTAATTNNDDSDKKDNVDPGVQALRRLLTGGPNLPEALRNLGRPVPGMFAADRPIGTFITDEEARELLPISPPLYDQEILTDRPERFIASEMIRAALFSCLKKELPYCCEVRIQKFKEPASAANKDGDGETRKRPQKPVIRIEADVLVERDSQKKIVIGTKAEKIKLVGTMAREKLEDFFQSQVYLKLNVKVDRDWRRKEDRLKEYGYIKSK